VNESHRDEHYIVKFKFYLRVDEEIAIAAIGAIDLLFPASRPKLTAKLNGSPKYANFPDGTARCFFIHLKR
jgi:hypothetical protein